jgi:hypothetical protein
VSRKLVRNVCRNGPTARVQRANGIDQFGADSVFQQIACGACPQRPDSLRVAWVSRQYKDSDIGGDATDFRNGFHAAPAPEATAP